MLFAQAKLKEYTKKVEQLCDAITADSPQTNCIECQKLLKEGIQKLEEDYVRALIVFCTANFDDRCSGVKDLVGKLIDFSIDEINSLEKIAEKSTRQLKIVNQKLEAEKAKVEQESKEKQIYQALATFNQALATFNQSLAVANKEEAETIGVKLESMRLPFLADSLLIYGQFKDALHVAYYGLLLDEGQGTPNNWKAFGEALRYDEEYSPILYKTEEKTTIQTIEPLSDHQILINNDQGVLLYDLVEKQIKDTIIGAHLLPSSLPNDFSNKLIQNKEGISMLNENSLAIKGICKLSHKPKLVSISPNNELIFLVSKRKENLLFNLSKDTIVRTPFVDQLIYQVEFNPNKDELFFTRTANAKVLIWDATGKKKGEIGENEIYIYDAAFSPNGDFIATANILGEVKLWDMEGKQLPNQLSTYQSIRKLMFFDQQPILVTLAKNEVHVWNYLENKSDLIPFEEGYITAIQENPIDGNLLIALNNGDVYSYNLLDKTRIRFEGHNSAIFHIATSKSNELLLTSSTDGTTKLWNNKGDILMDWDESSTSTPAFFSEDGKSIFVVVKDNTNIQKCTIPSIAYDKMDSKKDAIVSQLKENKSLSIQFLE